MALMGSVTPRSEHLLTHPETWHEASQSRIPLKQPQLTLDINT